MARILDQIEHITSTISDTVWPIFLPLLLSTGLFVSIITIFKIRKETTIKDKMKIRDLIGPASISLGAMIGTGAIIGVLGSLSNLSGQGQTHIEAIAIWALIGSLILIPLSYSETLISKIMKQPPKEYIKTLLSPAFGTIYAIAFIVLYIFGFGGFQFSGIDATITIITDRFMGIELAVTQRYLFVVIPLIIIASAIILTKKHDLFINSMTIMIGMAVVIYFAFFFIFVFRTSSHLGTFFTKLFKGLTNPIPMLFGIPLGLVLGLQRVIQTAESGLGALAMAAQESDSEPRSAAIISVIPAAITVIVAILVTSYITSYGVAQGIIKLPADGLARLFGYFDTAVSVTGMFGLVGLSLFTILSGLTTLLGSYYFLSVLLDTRENVNIAIYIVLITLAGTLAVFGFGIVFDVVDLLLFVVSGINVAALVVFSKGKWKDYKLKEKNGECRKNPA
ncbi:hypothetical protein [Anaeromicrobium sediminis]|uniref:Sodium:solute symporter n=1 Tax=Anaeromicrobium sediminis TaxID=1478221 RepID=A0A267MGS7_9FIRM|nr:hypothetical protein [Anaeromicrobium sediminis]PAB58784.1 hypothetical protein CCE28_12875 [Anaeromicrobium sediminis]